jgi:hypothetical protein
MVMVNIYYIDPGAGVTVSPVFQQSGSLPTTSCLWLKLFLEAFMGLTLTHLERAVRKNLLLLKFDNLCNTIYCGK